MAVAFYVDDDIGMKPTIVGLRRLGIEIDHCDAFGMRGAGDEAHLAFAHSIRRVLISANRRDFARLHRDWIDANQSHSGIVLVEQRTSIGNQVSGLARIHAERTAEQMANQVYYLNNWLDSDSG